MKTSVRLIFFISMLFMVCATSATYADDDEVTARILVNFDKKTFKNVEAASDIPTGGIVQLWGWLKFESKGKIEPQTYYLEWEYRNGEEVEKLGNYNTNRKHLVYERKLDRADDYYWVSKRIWVQDEGEYVFRVYIRKGQDYQIVNQEIILIKESNQ